jgi:hypothetical protein
MNDGEHEDSSPPKQIRAEGADAEFPEVAKTREAGPAAGPAAPTGPKSDRSV